MLVHFIYSRTKQIKTGACRVTWPMPGIDASVATIASLILIEMQDNYHNCKVCNVSKLAHTMICKSNISIQIVKTILLIIVNPLLIRYRPFDTFMTHKPTVKTGRRWTATHDDSFSHLFYKKIHLGIWSNIPSLLCQ